MFDRENMFVTKVFITLMLDCPFRTVHHTHLLSQSDAACLAFPCLKSALLMLWRTKPFSCVWHAVALAAYTLIMPNWCQDLLNNADVWS